MSTGLYYVSTNISNTVAASSANNDHHKLEEARAFVRKVGTERDVKSLYADLSNNAAEINSSFGGKAGHNRTVIATEPDIAVDGLKRSTTHTVGDQSVRKAGIMESSGLSTDSKLDRQWIKATETPVKTALLQPYRPGATSGQEIARLHHGLQHSCRTATWALAVLQLRKEQQDRPALAFPDRMVPLLVKACLFHDSGREDDGEDQTEWERASADNLMEHLRNCGIAQNLAWQCGEAVRNKDYPDACKYLPEEIQTLRSLLHDADCLDVMRVRSCFFMNKLDCFATCQNEHGRKAWRQLAEAICQVIASQGDLWHSISLSDSAKKGRGFFRIQGVTGSERIKKQFEHHPSPLWYQFSSIVEESAVIGGLITPFINHRAGPEPAFSLNQLQPGVAVAGCPQLQTRLDPVSNRHFYLNPAPCELSACNQVLMANIARLLGMNVPDTFAHQEAGQSYVVSHVASDWLGNLKSAKEHQQSLSPKQWARLLLINAIVGNEDLTWENMALTSEGEPVVFNWNHAGLATRYPCAHKPEPAPGEDDFSSMPLLLNKLRDPQVPAMNSHPIASPCVDSMSKLDDNLLGQTLKELLHQFDWQALGQLIEQSGYLAGDRSWLRQTIHDRIAWLTTRLPDTLEPGERVSMAEYQAIRAAGIRGGWLQVKGQDIRTGQVCLTQLLDQDGQPITRMTLRLSRDAGNRVADNLALERGLYHLSTWSEYVSKHLNGKYCDWRSDLTSLADECEKQALQLTQDIERWQETDRQTIIDVVNNLHCITKRCRASLTADQPSIETLPPIQTPLPAPALPARVSSRLGEEREAQVRLSEFSHGFAKLTGESVSYVNQKQLEHANLTASPVRVIELAPTFIEKGSIEFYPERDPNARTFDHKMVLTAPGHEKAVVEALFRELAELGIDHGCPDAVDLEERWLDSLADYHRCLGDMNRAVAAAGDADVDARVVRINAKKTFLAERLGLSLRPWYESYRIHAGRLIGYLPGQPHGVSGSPARGFCPVHGLNYTALGQPVTGIVAGMLNNERALTSFVRRTDIGLEPFQETATTANRFKCAIGHDVYTRIQPCSEFAHSQYAGALSMTFKPAALMRLDADFFLKVRSLDVSYPGLKAIRPNEKVIVQSAGDYQQLIKCCTSQETLFALPLSLPDELDVFTIGSAKDQLQLLYILRRRYSHWPDGRPLEQIFLHSWLVCYLELTSGHNMGVPENVKTLVQACGKKGIQRLMQQNPQLLEGKLKSLDGLEIAVQNHNHELEKLDFSDCSMNGTVFKATQFRECKFNMEPLNSASFEDVSFINCGFAGKCFSPSVLKGAKFFTWVGKRSHLSQLIYQSCFAQQSDGSVAVNGINTVETRTVNPEQWLQVMIKNDFLRICSSDSLDGFSQEILDQHLKKMITSDSDAHVLIREVLGYQFESIYGSLNFVKNNPDFHRQKFNDLSFLYFDFKRKFYSNQFSCGILYFLQCNNRGKLSGKATLTLLLNCLEFMMWPEGKKSYIEYGNDSKITKKGDKKHCKKTDPDELTAEKLSYMELSSINKKLRLEMGCFDELNRDSLKRFLDKSLEDFRADFHKYWKDCSKKDQLAIAKDCLATNNIAVSYVTTVAFMKLLIDNGKGAKWQSAFVTNIARHKTSKYFNDLSDKRVSRYYWPAADRIDLDTALTSLNPGQKNCMLMCNLF
ncbi:hypothetical protein [Endozoicomonas sp. ALE010]|uniref:hypothetical protein n=1 Tax=Endozoicomonas sp. ALE010 TaxID=3403081 RepID=UPI003BB4D489